MNPRSSQVLNQIEPVAYGIGDHRVPALGRIEASREISIAQELLLEIAAPDSPEISRLTARDQRAHVLRDRTSAISRTPWRRSSALDPV